MVSMQVYHFPYLSKLMCKDTFELQSLVSETHGYVDMVIGIKNVYEIEGVLSTRNSCLHFLKRSTPFLPKTDVLQRTRE